MDRLFDTYAELVPTLQDFFRDRFPKDPARLRLRLPPGDQGQGVRRRARASCRRRRCRTSASTAPARRYEALLLRMRAHPLPEARSYADLMLTELRKVIPVVPQAGRPPRPGRGLAARTWPAPASPWRSSPRGCSPTGRRRRRGAARVALVDFDPDGEVKLLAAMLYPYTDLPEAQIEAPGAGDDGRRAARRGAGLRRRAHQPPPQAGPGARADRYRFDVLADYGAFRDLQRHRMLTIEWQPLSPRHGYTRPEAVDLAGLAAAFDEAMERSAALHDALADRFPEQAPYAVSLAYRVRFVMQMNAREAMHLLELRTAPQGHPAYRLVAQEMHRLIAEQAGHHAVAEVMRFVDHSRARARAPRRRAPGRAAPRLPASAAHPARGASSL